MAKQPKKIPEVQIDVRQAEALFDVLDYNNSGTLDLEEFLEAGWVAGIGTSSGATVFLSFLQEKEPSGTFLRLSSSHMKVEILLFVFLLRLPPIFSTIHMNLSTLHKISMTSYQRVLQSTHSDNKSSCVLLRASCWRAEKHEAARSSQRSATSGRRSKNR